MCRDMSFGNSSVKSMYESKYVHRASIGSEVLDMIGFQFNDNKSIKMVTTRYKQDTVVSTNDTGQK